MCESLVTLWTAEWFFTSANSFMTLLMLCHINFLSHFQLYGFSPFGILSCVLKILLVINFLSYLKRLNGFSSLWTLSWLFKSILTVWTSSHTLSSWMASHQYRFFNVSSNGVGLQTMCHSELLFTLWVIEWFFTGVNPFMSLQMTSNAISNFLSHFE